MRDSRREAQIVMEGGLDLETPSLTVRPGRMLACKNYEVNTLGGYTRIEGYERFDGRLQPSDAPDGAEREVRRAAIGKPPGTGKILGVHVFKGEVYCLQDQNDGSSGFFKATPSGWSQITTPARDGGGRAQFTNYNFKASATTEVMIGADGVNSAFVYDGSTFTEISIPGETGFPMFCRVMNNYLFLALNNGTVYYSVAGEPTNYEPVDGAGTFGSGDFITGLEPAVGGAMAILMRNRIAVLYGNGPDEWSKTDLRNHDDQVGAVAYSALNYNQLYYLDDRGITSLQATQAFGNFASATLSTGVNPFLRIRRGQLTDGVVSRRKNQLRWVFTPSAGRTGSEVLTATFTGNQMTGFSRQVYDHQLSVIESGELLDGEEIIVAGTDDGWVMRFDRGTSFDGQPIEAYFRLPFAHMGAPQKRKHYLNALFNIQASGKVDLKIKPLFNFNDPGNAAHRVSSLDIIGGGSNWDEGNWNEFVWSAQVNSEAFADIAGTGKNVAFVIYSKSANIKPFTFYDALVHYTLRNWYR